MNEDIPVKLDIRNGVATLALNRPEKGNTLDGLTIATLTQLLHHLENNDHVSIVILTGEGKNFCTGMDIQWMRESNHVKTKNEETSKNLAKLLKTLYHLQKPTIAIVKGSAFDEAIGLIACCDISLATPNAVFCFSEVKLGRIPAVSSPYLFSTVQPSAIKRYLLTAETFGAKKARRLGLISEVIASEKLPQSLNTLIEKIYSNGPNALSITKNLIHKLNEERCLTEAQLSYSTQLMIENQTSLEAQEGLSAFLAKRKPKWQTE